MIEKYSIVRKKISASVGMQSLIGVRQEFPVSWGNYFSFSPSREDIPDIESLSKEDKMAIIDNPVLCPRCVNMWSENLRESVNRFLPDKKVEVDIITDSDRKLCWAVVVDERIPRDWLLDGPYFTGYYGWDKELSLELQDRYGWTDEELDRYINPRRFYARIGRKEGRYKLAYPYTHTGRLRKGT